MHPDRHSRGCHAPQPPRHTFIPSPLVPSRHHSRSQHQYTRFISPSSSRENRRPKLKQDLGMGSSSLGGLEYQPHLPWLGAQTRDPTGQWPGVLVPQACGAQQEQHQRRGGPPSPRTEALPQPAGWQIHIHTRVCLLRPAASRLPTTGPQRRPPPGCPQHRSGQGHEDSGELWAPSRACGVGHVGQGLTPFSTLW